MVTTDSVRQEKGDTIYRQDAIDAIEDCAEFIKDIHQLVTLIDADTAKTKVRAIPSAQKKGEWLYDEEREATGIYAICSCCDEKVYQCGEWLFCPRCGADMRGDTDG